MDVAGASQSNNANVQLYNANGSLAQIWDLKKIERTVADGLYQLGSLVNSGKVIDVSGGSLNDGAAVQIYGSNSTLAQYWTVSYDAKSGYYVVRSAASGKVLDCKWGGTASGTKIQQYSANGSAAQKWLVEIGDNGGIIIRSFKNGIVLGAISNDLKLVDMATHADDEGVFADQSWIFASTTYFEGPQARRDANARQNRVLYSCDHTPSPGSGLCAAWVANVFNNAGLGCDGKDARDFYWSYCHDSNRNDLKVGMIIAVPSHNKSYLGGIYGHICLYIGDGMVMDNIGNLRKTSLSHWLSYYGNVYTPKWGWYRNIALA